MCSSDLQNHLIFRDWKRGDLGKAIADGKVYPTGQIMLIPVERWPRERQKAYIEERVALHQNSESLKDDDLPVCSKEERWERGEAWAVHKGTNKRAERVFSSPEEASAYMGVDKGLNIIHRPGKSTRCMEYCSAAPFCSFYAHLMGQKETVSAAA